MDINFSLSLEQTMRDAGFATFPFPTFLDRACYRADLYYTTTDIVYVDVNCFWTMLDFNADMAEHLCRKAKGMFPHTSQHWDYYGYRDHPMVVVGCDAYGQLEVSYGRSNAQGLAFWAKNHLDVMPVEVVRKYRKRLRACEVPAPAYPSLPLAAVCKILPDLHRALRGVSRGTLLGNYLRVSGADGHFFPRHWEEQQHPGRWIDIRDRSTLTEEDVLDTQDLPHATLLLLLWSNQQAKMRVEALDD